MRRLALVLCFLALAVPGCSGRVAAKPGVGIGVEHRDNGGRLGLDLGEYGVDGAAVEPITGNCPGGVCAIPSAPPRVKVDTGIPGAAVWVIAGLLGALLVGGAYVVARKAAR